MAPTAEVAFRREIAPWALLGLTLGLVEGATAAVLIKRTFADAADPWLVNLAVAFVSGAPALSNVVSFVWANLAHGRSRIGLMVGLQATFAVLVGLLGLAPRALGGLALAVASILIARVVWTGILTVRAAVWSANYPRQAMGRYTGRIVIVSSLAVALTAALAARTLDKGVIDSRWLFGAGAAAGLLAAWLYRSARVRREFALLAEENAAAGRSEPFSLGMLFEILRKDPHFRPGSEWTWTANALLRERFLWEFAGARKDRISLKDTFAILSTRGTGGMALDGFNNPAGFYSMTSYVAVAKTGDLWLSHGNPSKVHFHRYPLEEAGR